MANINSNPTKKANLSKHGFDMSQILKFTSACGQLLPVYYDFLNPGEKVRFSAEMFTRTPNLLSPAMVKITNHCDWFFVPLEQLYKHSKDALFGISDNQSNIFTRTAVGSFVTPTAKVSDISSVLTEIPLQDVFGYEQRYGAVRLLDLLGYSNRSYLATSQNSDLRVNTLLLQAYHKIYFDCYRLTDREGDYSSCYNTDNVYENGEISFNQLASMLVIRYRPWKRDLFTNVFPSPLINGGDVSMLSNSDLSAVNQWLTPSVASNNRVYGNPRINKTSVSGNDSSTTNITYNINQSVFNTANIRSMFAVEKLAEITRFAPKTYDAQVLAHFGFKVPEGVSGKVYRLGSDSAPFNIGDVVSTADTDGAALGKMAGQAASYKNGKQKSFIAPCHGILMAIYSAVPEADYQATGLDRFNTYRNREDFYQPEFDRLGMQPLFYYQRRFVPENLSVNNQILGWQYRYAEAKQKYGKITGGFLGALRNWTVYREAVPTGALSDFIINPTYLNSILPDSFDPESPNVYETDYFYNMFQFHVFKSSTMSTYGLPNL